MEDSAEGHVVTDRGQVQPFHQGVELLAHRSGSTSWLQLHLAHEGGDLYQEPGQPAGRLDDPRHLGEGQAGCDLGDETPRIVFVNRPHQECALIERSDGLAAFLDDHGLELAASASKLGDFVGFLMRAAADDQHDTAIPLVKIAKQLDGRALGR